MPAVAPAPKDAQSAPAKNNCGLFAQVPCNTGAHPCPEEVIAVVVQETLAANASILGQVGVFRMAS
jgi:hypothetical protein